MTITEIHVRNVPAEAWERLRTYLMQRHGSYYRWLGKELGVAILEYLDRRHTQQHAAFPTPSRARRDTEERMRLLRVEMERRELTQYNRVGLQKLIESTLRCKDDRTIKKYWREVFHRGWLLEGDGLLFRVNPQYVKVPLAPEVSAPTAA